MIVTEMERARHIAKTLGVYRAARYLRKRGWTLAAALVALSKKPNESKE